MQLYEMLGLSYAGVEPNSMLPVFRMEEAAIRAGGQDLGGNLCSHVASCNTLAIRYYLIGDRPSAARYGNQVVSTALTYFFGTWRESVKTDDGTIDPVWWHGVERWIDAFSSSICWGSLVGRWDDVKRLAQYPDERRSEEKSGINKKPALRRWLLDVAAYLGGEGFDGKSAERVEALSGANWRGVKSLARALDAIACGDAVAAHESVEQAARAVKKTKTKNVRELVALEASFLRELARTAGIEIAMNPNLEPYLISTFALTQPASPRGAGF